MKRHGLLLKIYFIFIIISGNNVKGGTWVTLEQAARYSRWANIIG
jgi:hypothetical protein